MMLQLFSSPSKTGAVFVSPSPAPPPPSPHLSSSSRVSSERKSFTSVFLGESDDGINRVRSVDETSPSIEDLEIKDLLVESEDFIKEVLRKNVL